MIARASKIASLAVGAAVLMGCVGPTPVHAPTVRPEQVDPERAREAAKTLVQTCRPARNVAVQATLWETSLLAAERAAEEPRMAEDELQRWHERDILDATTFTVVVELEQRLGDPDTMEPLLDPEGWSFSLERGDRTFEPRSVEVSSIDRFPMEAAGHHWRVALTVRFPGNLHRTALVQGPGSIVLHMRLPPLDGPRRERLGRHLTSRGISLRWRLEPATSTRT